MDDHGRRGTLNGLHKRLPRLLGAAVDELEIHWYRRADQGNWILIESASGNTHRVSADDRGSMIMAVLVVRDRSGEVKRISSNLIGPVSD